MYRKYLLVICIGVFAFTACEKNVLDKKPLDVIDEETIWSDPTVAQLYVNDLYNYLSWQFIWDNMDNMSDLTEGGHTWLGCYAYYFGQVTSDNDPYSRWGYYNQIRSLNVLLDNAGSLTGDTALARTVVGEATFLRAYYYFYLVRAYGGVPLITKAQSLTDSLSDPRNSFEECIDFIASEMDKAAAMLPDVWEGSNIGRATRGAALGLKARALLYAASELNNPSNDATKWQRAADASKAVIDLGTYSLYPDYGQLFLDDNNQEVMFDVQWAYPFRINGDPAEIIGSEFVINPQGINGAFGMNRPTQEYVDMFEMANGKSIKDPTSGYNPADPYVNRDPRFYASIFYNGVEWRDQTVETFVGGNHGPGEFDIYETSSTMTGYYCRKFTDPSIPVVYLVDEVKANWILMRYAEMLLNYAETQIALGNEEEARKYINMVRERSGMPPTEATGNALVTLYRNERAVELGMEEHRYYDVRRWKIAGQTLGNPVHKMTITKTGDNSFEYEVEEMEERVFNPRMYWQPIPIDEIRKNSKLVQNPGY